MLEEQTQTSGASGDQAGGQYKQNNTQSVGGVTDKDHQNGQDLFEIGIHGMTPCKVLIEGTVADQRKRNGSYVLLREIGIVLSQ